ncbi:restriction endonuclease subunit S [Fusobacterium sp.]|uniref:restriction endonuclease subunit S n=1 Tax=Fusobacterium sp. TaxID=68766 RepID=UPI002629D62C|nr:restriction endonuclease subunit S [Fusobacterium sp.]
MPKKKENLSHEEKLQKAIIPKEEEPYKIPDNWVWTRLENIGLLQTGTTPSTSIPEYFGKNIPFITPADIRNEKIIYTNRGLSILGKEKGRIAKKNSILQVCIGGSIGKVFYVDRDVCFNQQINSITLYDSEYKFIYFLLKSDYFYQSLLNNSRGTATPIINKNIWGNLMIPLPPLEEQKRIVEKLDSLFEKTQKIKDIIEEVKEKTILRREAIISKAFTGDLTEKWRSENKTSNAEELLYKINDEKIKLWEEECKKAEGEGRKKPKKPQIKDISEMLVKEDEAPYKIPENWVWIRLDNISEKISKGTTPKGGESAYVKNGIKFLRVENITKNYKLDLDKIKYISNETHVSFLKRSILEENDLLISIAGSLGRTTVISKDNLPLNTNQAIAFIRFLVKDKSFSKFFSYFFNTPIIKTLLLEQAKVTAIPNLTLEILSKTKILLPPLEEQKEIVRILDKVFEEEDKINELLKLEESIAALESSILDKAFKGELGTQNKDDYPILERLKEIL